VTVSTFFTAAMSLFSVALDIASYANAHRRSRPSQQESVEKRAFLQDRPIGRGRHGSWVPTGWRATAPAPLRC